LTFQDAQLRLLAYVRDRIRNGELTERGFARRIGVSQPHVHNVLKGARNLSPEIIDLMLKHLHLSLLDLAPADLLEAHLRQRQAAERPAEAPFLASPIGPGLPWPQGIDWRKSFPLPFPSPVAPPHLVMANLAADLYMYATLAQADIALLDTSEVEKSNPVVEGLYVVSLRDEAVVRYTRRGTRGYYLVTDATLDNPMQWEHVPATATGFVEFIKARVLWLGREQDRALPMRQRGRFLYEPISR